MEEMTVAKADTRMSRGLWVSIRGSLLGNKAMLAGTVILGLWFLLAILSPLLVPKGPYETFRGMRLAQPSAQFPFGADSTGRDVLARVLYGFRYDIFIALSSIALGLLVGVVVGALGATAGGWVDNVLMRVMDVFFAFPPFLLALMVAGALGRNMFNLILSVSVVFIPLYARLIRGNMLKEKEKEYVEAARSLGLTRSRIILYHLLPNSVGPVITQSVMNVSWAIMTAAGISFLGFGVQPPTPEWGLMISEGAAYIVSGEWWVSFFPGIAVFSLIAGLTLLDDGLRSRL
jgi:peptide/nickel transport system permease protein